MHTPREPGHKCDTRAQRRLPLLHSAKIRSLLAPRHPVARAWLLPGAWCSGIAYKCSSGRQPPKHDLPHQQSLSMACVISVIVFHGTMRLGGLHELKGVSIWQCYGML